jgi:hypothetical protein
MSFQVLHILNTVSHIFGCIYLLVFLICNFNYSDMNLLGYRIYASTIYQKMSEIPEVLVTSLNSHDLWIEANIINTECHKSTQLL